MTNPEHVLDTFTSPSARKFSLLVCAALCFVSGVWLIVEPSPQPSATPPPAHPAIRVGVLGGPEVDVLEHVRERHPELGLELVRYEDPARINDAVVHGELEAASFQDGVSLEEEVTRQALPLAPAALTLTLPLGFYSKTLKRLDELGPGSRVVLSSEPTAQGRALLVLYHYGLIDFDRDPTPWLHTSNIKKNPRELRIETVPPDQLAAELEQAALVALEYDQATQAKLAPARHALGLEDAYTPFAQVLTVRASDHAAKPSWLVALLAAYTQRDVKELILNRFQDSVRRPW